MVILIYEITEFGNMRTVGFELNVSCTGKWIVEKDWIVLVIILMELFLICATAESRTRTNQSSSESEARFGQ